MTDPPSRRPIPRARLKREQAGLKREQRAPQPPRDRVALTVAALPGLAAMFALIFTGLQVLAANGQLRATENQLKITEQGQITDRYNAAIANLGSSSIDVRLGGIYAQIHGWPIYCLRLLF